MHDPGVRVADEAVAPFLESTKRYGVAAFSLVTFLPFMVSPIVKPGPTVPVTVFAVAADEQQRAGAADRFQVTCLLRCDELTIEPGI